MPYVDLKRLLSAPANTLDFLGMIEDLEGFLDFSESNMESQYRRKLQAIQQEPTKRMFPESIWKAMLSIGSKSFCHFVSDTEQYSL